MRALLTTLLVVFCSAMVVAAPVTTEQVREMVTGWRLLSDAPLELALSKEIASITPIHDTNSVLLYYVVNLAPEGFILTAPDDEIEPVIAVSAHAQYERDARNPLTTLVENDMRGRLLLVPTPSLRVSSLTTATSVKQTKWKYLTDAALQPPIITFSALGSVDDVRVPPLLQTRWNQSTVGWPKKACYNYYSPPYEAGNVSNYVSGCTQTVWAQIMRYFMWPQASIGVITNTIHVDGVDEQRTTLGGAYDWGNMPNVPDGATPENQRQAIGALLYDIGVVNGASYSIGGTSTGMSVYDLKQRFGYSNASYTSPSYTSLSNCLTRAINANLDAGLPVQISLSRTGGGHAVVGDGYGYNVGSLYHHLNLGWGGSADAWYQLPDVDTGSYHYDVLTGVIYNVYTNGTGEIVSGRVLDESGSPLAGVSVSICWSSLTNTVVSNERGIYAFTALPSGRTYTLSAVSETHHYTNVSVFAGTSPSYGVPGNVWGANLVGALADYTVSYDGNGATSGTAPASQPKAHDLTLTLASNSGNLANTGYSFAGWNTATNGTGTSYAAGGSYTANASVTLYAKWVPTYPVIYDGNGATSGSAPGSQTKTHDVTLTLAYNSGNLARTGYTFAGWNTAVNGSGTTYAAGASYTANASVTLYALWEAVDDGGVYRFWSNSLMSHFFTASAAERDDIIATWPDVWTYEGTAFYVHRQAVNGSLPVHRFWSDRIGCHVFTISDTEKSTLQTRYSKVFTYEGTAWHAFDYQAPGTLPVYRFWAPKLKKPFFTISEAEKDNIIATMYSTWSYKGIAWYAYASASVLSSSSIDPQSKASTACISEFFVEDVGQAGELPGAVIFGLSYGADEVVSAMVHDPVANTFMQVLEPTLSPRELMIPPLTFGHRYWLSVMSHHLDDEKMSLDYGGWLGRVSEVPEEEIATVDGQVDSPLDLPVEHIVLPESKDPLVLHLYDRADNRLIQTIGGLEGGTTYELSVPAWNRWYRVDIVRDQDGEVLESQWVGHQKTH